MTHLYIARGNRLAARKLEAETVILRADDSGLFVLNELGSLLWGAADGTTPLATIVEQVICPQFDVDTATALQDATRFAESLRDHQILELSDAPMVPLDLAPLADEAGL
ncbi:MAG: PqqD family protein [Acidobacteriota bacterium]